MARRITVVLFVIFALGLIVSGLNTALAADGEKVFQSNGCAACHKTDKKTVGSSLKDIAGAYGSPDALVAFFNSGQPKMTTPMPAQMKAQMPKIQKLPEDDKKALAQYVFTFK